ncbi:MAG: hypothetical protein KA792_03635 [Bacteroidales bacterium]|nr:hypothetical protein [Bacteroidales bacterium]
MLRQINNINDSTKFYSGYYEKTVVTAGGATREITCFSILKSWSVNIEFYSVQLCDCSVQLCENNNYTEFSRDSTELLRDFTMYSGNIVGTFIKDSRDNQQPAGRMFYLLKDHLGSITGLVNESGQLAEEYSYDAWGRRRKPNNWSDYTVIELTLSDG